MIHLKYKTISTTPERTLRELITLSGEKDSVAGQQKHQLPLSFTELPATLKYLLLVKNLCLLLNCVSSPGNNLSFSLLLFKASPWFRYLRWLNSPKSLLRKICHWKTLSICICCIQTVSTIIFWAMRICSSFFSNQITFLIVATPARREVLMANLFQIHSTLRHDHL